MNIENLPKKANVAILTGNKKIELKSLTLPNINDDEILVKVEACGICGTDVHEYKGDPFGYIPIQLGHEGTGTIVRLGKNITHDFTGKPLAVGDKIVTGLRPCGKCDICLNHPEQIHLCNGGEIFGLMPGENHFFNGWFGDYIKINKGGIVFNVSDMSLDLRVLIEPAAVVIHAIEKAKEIFNFKHDSTVLIQGCGPIGLLLLTIIRTMGVRHIIAVDGEDSRLQLAQELGAQHTINFIKSYDSIEDVMKLSKQGVDMAFQCTGSTKAASTIWKYIRRGGSLCELGFFVNNGEANYNPHFDICNKEIKVVGSWTYKAEDWVHACEFLKEAQARKLPIEKLISHRYPLKEINQAMEMNMSIQGYKIIIQN